MKKTLTLLIIIVLIVLGFYLFTKDAPEQVAEVDDTQMDSNLNSEALMTDEEVDDTQTVVGSSVDGRDIVAYHYGAGDKEILFVGGIHGGYSWNTALVGYEMMDYLETNPEVIPENLKITVVPVLNPDGLEAVVGTEGRFSAADVPSSEAATVVGRFNANDVDINRNFDCDWQADAVWQSKEVSGGTKAFSEPEAKAIADYVADADPVAVVVYYSAAGGVFASNCHDGVLPETTEITNVYAKASGYPAYQSFDFYATTGDMVNWLAKKGVPGISVLLTNHSDVEWSKNKAGLKALMEYYSE